jgi:ring-1,2-phenylacetyl-CoA epoxidase subunit PaaE
MAQFHKLTIDNIQQITEQSVALSFKVPEALATKFEFDAGQYLTLKAEIKGEMVRRDYSICSSKNSGQLSVGIKAVEGGTFSVFANKQLKVGDEIEVAEPQGRFLFQPHPEKTRTVAAFAAGSGITPILSIAKTLLEEEPFSNFILVYGNKTEEDTMFASDLEYLKSRYDNRFHIHHIYSQSRAQDTLFGRIDKSIVNLIVKNKYKGVNIECFYLCGPEPMIETVKETLLENKVRKEQVYFELFTAPTAAESNTPTTTDGNSKITVIVDEESFELEMSQKQTILEAALKANIDAPYSCQGGICSSCIARLTEGSAEMVQNNILTDSEVAEGLILTCQAHPTANKVVVDYDDV